MYIVRFRRLRAVRRLHVRMPRIGPPPVSRPPALTARRIRACTVIAARTPEAHALGAWSASFNAAPIKAGYNSGCANPALWASQEAHTTGFTIAGRHSVAGSYDDAGRVFAPPPAPSWPSPVYE